MGIPLLPPSTLLKPLSPHLTPPVTLSLLVGYVAVDSEYGDTTPWYPAAIRNTPTNYTFPKINVDPSGLTGTLSH